MITESHYWKKSLLKHAGFLRKRKTQKRWSEASYARVEETVMLAFYSIRKLIEAAKLATKTAEMTLEVVQYPWNGEPVTRLNWHRLHELYDFDTERIAWISLKQVCNQIVHSYVFTTTHSESNGLDGFLFVSDRDRHRHLHFLSVDQVIELFEHAGNDYPDILDMTQNDKTGDYDVMAITRIKSGFPDC